MRKINVLRKIFLILFLSFIGLISVKTIAATEMENLVVNGTQIKYRVGGADVKINKEHDATGGEFRGVWVSALTGDISGFGTESAYKRQMIDVLKNMEKYNLNTMIFHVRIMNDAFYKSKYNNWSSYYNTDPSWDMLPWLIEECHKRGIEFHAWMNPYRVTTKVSMSFEEIASSQKGYNAASNPKNLLRADSCIILNPGEPAVREFLVNTCMELAQNYDIDAIHFDDYFYAAGIDDSETVAKYNKDNLSIDNFRRQQVDLFIEELHKQLTTFNNETGRRVQLGIAPTGVYRNGNGYVTYDENGNAVTNGSKTSAYAHYGSPLYADTVKWINNGWIDYMLPQTYWAITNSAGPYCDLVKWWNDVCAHKKTNLYSSLGLYMSSGGNASWSTNKREGYQQIMFGNTMEHVKGSSIYNYLSMVSSFNKDSAMQGVKDIWDKAIYIPEIRNVEAIVPNKVKNLTVSLTDYGNKLSFENSDDAKFFVIYRSESPLTYDEEEIIDVIGSTNEIVEFSDQYAVKGKTYYYGVKVQSRSNTLGEAVSVSTENIQNGKNLYLGEIPNVLLTDNLVEEEKLTLRFDNLYYPYGSDVKYSIDYTFKNDSGIIESKEDVSTIIDGGKNYCYITIPKNASSLTLKLKAANDCGESDITLERNIYKSLGKIDNLLIKGKEYNNQLVDLIFENPQKEDVKYVLQTSRDGYNFTDYFEITNYTANYNVRTQFNLTADSGKVYYRVKATTEIAQGYSDVIEINQINKIDDITNLLVQGKINYQLQLEEDDKLVLKWDNSDDDIQYMCSFSMDKVSWSSIKLYDNTSLLKLNNDTYSQEISINYHYFIFYLKITGSSKEGEVESDVITITVKLETLFSDEVVDYINKNNNRLIESMDIFE